jgi:hypothetical protein
MSSAENVSIEQQKQCSRCFENKIVDNFHKDKKSSDGYGRMCKLCRKLFRKNHYENNKNKELEQMKNWRENNPDYFKKWLSEHPNYYKEWQMQRQQN